METIRSDKARQFPLAITDPQPVAKVETIWKAAPQIAMIGIFLILLVAAIEYARPILLPVISAFMLGMMLGPLSNIAARVGVPAWLSGIVLWLLVIAVFYGLILLLSAALVDWIGKAPEIGQSIKDKLRVLDRPISALQDLRDALFPKVGDEKVTFGLVSLLQPAMTVITPAIGQIIIFFGTLFFFLLGRMQLRHVLVALFDDREAQVADTAHSQRRGA